MKTLLIAIACMVMLASCSSDGNGEAISYAETLIGNSDYTGAQKACDELIKGKELESFSANELCRLSIIYMKLSENGSEDENTATATQCYRMAIAVNADSAASYFANIPIEEVQYAATLRSLAKSIDNPQEIFDYELTDSITLTPDSIHEK